MKIKFILTAFLPVLFFSGLSCNSPTEPKVDPGPDTTSHFRSWTMETLGGMGSGLNEVTVINDTCIWVFGILYDDTSVDNRWNAAKWNGHDWVYFKIKVKVTVGPDAVTEIKAAWYDQVNTIWLISDIGSYCKITTKGEVLETQLIPLKGSPRKLWGHSPTNWFLVGGNGSLTEYNGTSLKLLPTETTIPMHSISGNATGSLIFFSGLELFGGGRSGIIKKENNTVSMVMTRDPALSEKNLSVSWFNPKSNRLWILNDNNFGYYTISDFKVFSSRSKFTFFPESITGTGDNNIFIAGHLGGIAHFNGSTLYEYPDFKKTVSIFSSVVIYKNSVFAVGYTKTSDQGVIVTGK